MGALRFRLLGFPVNVQPGFWILALIFGFLSSGSVAGAVMWLAVIFVSILVHEFGHALAARRYGQEPVVYLHLFGGLTTWRQLSPLPPWRQIWVTLAGPLAGFGLGFLALFLRQALGVPMANDEVLQGDTSLAAFFSLLIFVNLFYSAVNLLPVLPLDGGQIMAVLLGPKRRHLAAGISLAVGLALALVFLRMNQPILAIIFGVSGVSSYFHARRVLTRAEIPIEALTDILSRARQLQEHGRHDEAFAMALAVYEASPDDAWRMRALPLAGWSAVTSSKVPEARAVLERVPPGQSLDVLLEASLRELAGQLPRAAELLHAARSLGDTRPELVGSLIRVWLKLGDHAKACELARAEVADLAPEDVRRLGAETLAAGSFEPAALLFETLFRQSRAVEDILSAARGWVRGGRHRQASELLERAVESAQLEWSQVKGEPDLRALVPGEA